MSSQSPTKPTTPEPIKPFIFHAGLPFVAFPLLLASLAFTAAMRSGHGVEASGIAIGAGAWVGFWWLLKPIVDLIRLAIYDARMKASGWAAWNWEQETLFFRMHLAVHEMFPLKEDDDDD